ncbi:unnamed protein product [Bemisia tabaci]|uniref:NADH dehydrogenase [ubiquinone] 1 alpha subcomplex subunit 7 n=1 Tax=Bemisia tabaci TaxID=7038 RepID=A0A9P0A3T5_BEMTA|nr:unnamed protein product [Bemisia tabaci]
MTKPRPQEFRDVTIGLRILRDLLLGRKHDRDNRFSAFVATRSPAPPQLPPGPHAKLSDNYYYTRDARHIVEPPLLIAGPQVAPQIESAESKSKVSANVLGVTPGKPYIWDAPDESAYDPSNGPQFPHETHRQNRHYG